MHGKLIYTGTQLYSIDTQHAYNLIKIYAWKTH